MKCLSIPVVCLLLVASCSNTPQEPSNDNDNLNNNSNDNDGGAGQEDPGFPCDFDADCNDGVLCNGQEKCVDNLCKPGIPPCEEGLICDEATRRCLECLQDSDCDDGLFCNGPESCTVSTGRCQSGSAPCTAGQACNETTQSCAGCTSDADCDDGQACTVDSCADGACRSEPSADCCQQNDDCSDLDPCTLDTCAAGVCRSEPLDCDNGVFCDGTELCVEGACVAGTSPCPSGQACNEADRTCDGNPPEGACCLGGSSCQLLTEAACHDQSGTFEGSGATCSPNPCTTPPATGACCLPNGNCQVLSSSACAGQSGDYNGNGSNCSGTTCAPPAPTGACCQPNATCSVATQTACTSGGGVYQGNNVTCALTQCSPAMGCGDAGAGDCCAEHETPSCQDASCCQTVCNVDDFCCSPNGAWDDICVQEARDLCGDLCPPLVNDACADATLITDGDTEFATIGATTDGPTNPQGLCNDDGETQTHHDIWFTYTASCSGNLTVSTCDQATYDTDVVVYSACTCPADVANLLGCNDDSSGCENFESIVVVPVTQGSCYLIRIGGWGAEDMGSGTVTITCQ